MSRTMSDAQTNVGAQIKSPSTEVAKPLPTPTELTPPTGSDVKQANPTNFSDAHSRFADDTHSYIREYIRNADQKATFFFAATTAIIAYLHQRGVAAHWLKNIQQWSAIDLIAFLAMFGLAIGAALFLFVVFPRMRGSKRGLIFFSAIAEHETATEYADEVMNRSSLELARAKLQHGYDLSKVCRTKYALLLVGFWASAVGAIATLLYLLFAP
jgi:hypothetical protein